MQTISVNKDMDYSAPILFIASYAPPTHKATEDLRKATADAALRGKTGIKQIQKPSAPTVTKKPVQTPKTTTLAVTPKKPVVKPANPVEKTVATAPKKPEIKSEEKKIEPKKPKPVAETPIVKKEIPTTPLENKVAKALDIDSPVIEQTPVHNSKQGSPCAVERNMGLEGAQISNNYREVEALRRHAQLQRELVQKWHPPIGVSPDCSCDISFFVNNKGVIEDIKMIKSSNVTMFDISARQALFSMKMPQWTYGNPLVISFKQ